MKVKPVKDVIDFLQPIVKEFEAEIIDAEWNMRESSLTLIIDSKNGVDLDLLEKVHRAVDAPLDELDPTFGSAYTLNCSSPGLDRPFKTEQDFIRHMGEKIEVHLYAPVDGKKYFEGELVAFEEGKIRIKTEEGEKEFPFEKTAKVCLLIEV
ncbi:MAG: ribosome maturation factor RimP [Clostridia bacterium]|nr:ribosome maturation factor RimP [Clostridia bacterium]